MESSQKKLFNIIDKPYNSFFVTLTYKDPVKGSMAYNRDLKRIASVLNNVGAFRLVSEIGDKGNFHWHYTICIKDNIKHKIFLNSWTNGNGFINIKQIYAMLGSFIYLRKDAGSLEEDTLSEKMVPYHRIMTNSSYAVFLKDEKEKHRNNSKRTKMINEVTCQLARYYKRLYSDEVG